MTYRGSFPGSGFFNGQNGQQQQWQQQPMQNNGFDAYGNAQSQFPQHHQPGYNQQPQQQPQRQPQQQQHYAQYQDASFVPIGYPQQPQPQPQPQQQVQALNYSAAHMNPSQGFNPTFDQQSHHPNLQKQHQQQQQAQYRRQSANYAAQMGQLQSFVQQPRPQQPNVATFSPQMQQQQAQNPVMSWQPMAPPAPSPTPSQTMALPAPSPTQSYQTTPQMNPAKLPLKQEPPQSYSSPQIQQYQPIPSRVNSPHVNSPIMAQSPQYPQQFKQNNGRNGSVGSVAGARMDHVGRVSASPRLHTQGLPRSPSVGSTRSPAPGLLPHQDTNSLLVCVAEDMFSAARKGVLHVADSLDSKTVQELAPRLEARLQLRYASVLCEETNNVMESETALAKGMALCDKYRFADLKYLMQFLQLKMLSQRKGKAAIKAIDSHVADAELLKHTHWVYVLRLFKASLYLESPNPSDVHAMENLKAIKELALQRKDHIIFVLASLLEGLGLLKHAKDDSVARIQECIAQCLQYQLDESIHIPQVDILLLMLDFACSLHQQSPGLIAQKLRLLQRRVDESLKDNSWNLSDTQVLLPIKKQAANRQVISADTLAVIRPGQEGDTCDYLVMSFWSKLEAFVMTYTYSGLGTLYDQRRADMKVYDFWDEALNQLERNSHKMRSIPTSLQEAIRCAEWRRELKCYIQILRGLHLATQSRWSEVGQCVSQLETLVQPSADGAIEGIVGVYTYYLGGVYRQGIGHLDVANSIYQHPFLNINTDSSFQGTGKQAESDVRLLAAFNRIWIMQHPDHRDDQQTSELLEQLRPLCKRHPNQHIRTVWHIVSAAIQTEPALPMTELKSHLSSALNGAKALGDVLSLSIALNLMRAKLFHDVVGDQALKSAKAGAMQAKRSHNLLWMSVAEGLLAQSYEVQQQHGEAQASWSLARDYASQAFKQSDTALEP
ncbi:mitochondrial membrane protein [Apiospora phragmitis]|uniref:Mitochondrial membrane protein n=1 Tax=Apiospora phragmitis TaxID=2905665 RepID=A0ABR1SUY8_9PEZI